MSEIITHPGSERPRLNHIDALRGFALAGIVVAIGLVLPLFYRIFDYPPCFYLCTNSVE